MNRCGEGWVGGSPQASSSSSADTRARISGQAKPNESHWQATGRQTLKTPTTHRGQVRLTVGRKRHELDETHVHRELRRQRHETFDFLVVHASHQHAVYFHQAKILADEFVEEA
eukprot:GHVT01004604.1.p3 GENE.GHVT01004604.1~~GHVT01004604.1.p3  ORF type:complete len:114 (-),score=14.59 GHVT01004604.1:437-778(-)